MTPFQSPAERLRADIDFCRAERFPRAELRVDDAAALLAEHDRLTEEVARLREALGRIENVADEIAQSENTSLMSEVLEYARAALRETI